jgi:exodeoxyribonuclease VII small subunit
MSRQSNPSISDKISKLDELVAWFEGEDFELEEALDTFAEAEKLAKEIESDLESFKAKLTVLKKDFSKD